MFSRPWSGPANGEAVSGLGELGTGRWEAPGAAEGRVRGPCEARAARWAPCTENAPDTATSQATPSPSRL